MNKFLNVCYQAACKRSFTHGEVAEAKHIFANLTNKQAAEKIAASSKSPSIKKLWQQFKKEIQK